jgi:hypothetical protein
VRRNNTDDIQCTFALWDLSTHNEHKHHEVEIPLLSKTARIKTPSCEYEVMIPRHTPETIVYEPGVFLMLPFTHFEYVNKKGGVPDKVAKKLGDNINHTAVTDE